MTSSTYITTAQAGSTLATTSSTAYRPSEWDKPELVYAKTDVGGYFFDAIIRADHTSTLRMTEHPVQTGSSIVDHAFKLPDHLTLEIGMSDAMDRFVSSQFGDNTSKSVSAYQTLKGLQNDRTLLTIQTRLNKYSNMLVESIHAPDDYKTRDGLRCTVAFREIIMATVTTTLVSARPNASQTSSKTTAQPTEPSSTVLGTAEKSLFGKTGHGSSGTW